MNEIMWGLTSQGNYYLHHQFLPLMEEAVVAEPAFNVSDQMKYDFTAIFTTATSGSANWTPKAALTQLEELD